MSQNFTPDLFHDVLEGYGELVLRRVLHSLIREDKLFTLANLNERMHCFPYGRVDRPNKPVLLTKLTNDDSMRQSGMALYCFLRLLPLLIGDLVPYNNRFWRCYLKLRSLMDSLFAQKFSQPMLDELDGLTSDFLRSYKSTFPNATITPKLHSSLHNRKCIEMTGPLYKSMVAPMEMRMSTFKMYANTGRNSINIPVTITDRYCDTFLETVGRCYRARGTDIGTCRLTTVGALPMPFLVAEHFDVTVNDSLPVANFISHNGTSYHPRDVVATGFDTMGQPAFFQITQIVTADSDSDSEAKSPLFIGHQHRTVTFDEHRHAYVLDLCESLSLVPLSEITDYHPLDMYKIQSEFYVVARYTLLAE